MHSRIALPLHQLCLVVLLSLVVALPALAGRRGPDIVGLAQSAPELTSLVEAVIAADLVDTLAGEGPFTVFAPTNEAFAAALGELGFATLGEVPVDALRGILLNHVVVGTYRSKTLERLDRRDDTLVALGGLALEFDRAPVQVNEIDVLLADLKASNGMVHVIDEVLLDPDPRPSITDLAVATPSLSILVDAAVRTGLDRVLDAGSPFTVFAPTNEAFQRLLDALEIDSLDEVDDRALVNVLLDHIVTREVDETEIGSRARLVTIGRLLLTVDGRRSEVNGLPIVSGGIEAGNGTVYVIDGVLLDD